MSNAPVVVIHALTLYRSHGNALGNLLLKDEVADQRGQHDDDETREERGEVGFIELDELQDRDAEGKCPQMGGGE